MDLTGTKQSIEKAPILVIGAFMRRAAHRKYSDFVGVPPARRAGGKSVLLLDSHRGGK